MLRGNRNLQLLFGGQVVASFGDWLYVLALAVLVYDLTGSATVVAALTFVRLLPYALFLPFAGVLADRTNRKAIMIGADLGRGACMLGLLFVGSAGTVWVAFPLVFGATVLSSLFKPAMSSVLPPLVGTRRTWSRPTASGSRWTRCRWCWGRLWAVSSFCSARRRPLS